MKEKLVVLFFFKLETWVVCLKALCGAHTLHDVRGVHYTTDEKLRVSIRTRPLNKKKEKNAWYRRRCRLNTRQYLTPRFESA